MKKAISILMCLLFVMTILYPAGVIITACLEYSFELVSVSCFSIVLSALSVCTIVLDLVFKNTLENNWMRILLTVITPLSLLNSVFYISYCPKIWVIGSVLFYIACCCYLTVKYGKPLALKIIALVLSVLMILPLGFFSFIALIFGNIAQNTVVKTVESPSGKYYAQVIDSDQGALGGNTIVDVYQECEINALLFKIKKKPQQVYSGGWGEFENMQIRWKNDNCLIINSVEYEIE
mgnify:FL=1